MFPVAFGFFQSETTDNWPKVNLGFNLLPPLTKRGVGRQRKNRIVRCLEKGQGKRRTKHKWQVQCKRCLGMGHRGTSLKCPLNGTKKKRKSRAKQERPLGSTSGVAGPSTPKRQKVARRQLALINAGGEGSRQMTTPSRHAVKISHF